jgi:crotonobetainyl-CoA:carnitine CoA-transferase CaiB-like acyl-CoA transferase
MHRALEGLKVVEFAGVLAGPAVGMFLAELGAAVVKIENKTTGGDMTRQWKLPGELAGPSAYFCSVNWGKRHMQLDLTNAADHAEALAQVAGADVVISNFKPDFARQTGLDAPALTRMYPRLIYAQLHAFADPADPRPAFDVVVQAEAGYMHMTGNPGEPPVKMPVALLDLMAAHQLKEGILVALLERTRTGRGSTVQTSLMESALASLANQASNWLMTGNKPERMGARHPNIAPYGDIFPCADRQLLLLAVGTERQFEQLLEVLGATALLGDSRFQTNTGRVIHREALVNALTACFQKQALAYWLDKLAAAGVPAARIRDLEAVFEQPEAQNMILEETLEGIPTRRVKTVAFDLIPNS